MITLAATRVDILQPNLNSGEEWDPTFGYTTLASGVRATVSVPSGDHLRTVANDSVAVDAFLNCDLLPVTTDQLNGCLVIDAEDGQIYAIEWATKRTDTLGLGHIHAGLMFRRGLAGA